MTADEVIAELKKHPGNTQVSINLEGISEIKVAHEVYSIRYDGETTLNLVPCKLNKNRAITV